MKNKIFKYTIVVMIVVMLVGTLSACKKEEVAEVSKVKIEPMEIEEVYVPSYDYIGGESVMPIGGYYGPYQAAYSKNGVSVPNLITEEIFKKISECGLNVINYTRYTGEDVWELAAKYNLGIVATDDFVTPTNFHNLSDFEISQRINKHANYENFCGIYVVDEPNWSGITAREGRTIEEYAPIYNYLADLGISAYSNLYPTYISSNVELYPSYVDAFLSQCKVPYLCCDFYLFDGYARQDFFFTLSTMRSKANEYKIPFWFYIQAGGQWNDGGTEFDSKPLYPTEGELLWNVNVSLAYGAKGIQYFPIVQPVYFGYASSTPFDAQRNGLIGVYGNTTQWYYYAQKANKQIAAVDAVLMNSVNKGILVKGEQPKAENEKSDCIIKGTSWRELKDISSAGNVMVGCFNYKGSTALYVVNYETEYNQEVNLELHDSYNVSITQQAEVARKNTDCIKLDMEPGEGVLIVFE